MTLFLAFIVVCVFVIVMCFQYYSKLHTTIRTESKGYLQEVALRIGNNMDRIIGDNYAALHNMASSVEALNDAPMTEVQALLQKQQSRWKYKNIMLVDEKGLAYDLNNNKISITFDSDMRKNILAGMESISTTQMINNQEFIVFSVPLNRFVIDGKSMVALAGSYDPEEFVKVLSMDSFNEQAYSQIITKSGEVITRPTSNYAMNTGYNMFTSLQNAKIDGNRTLQDIQADIQKDISDQVRLTFEGVDRYMVYTAINPEEWYLLTFVPAKVVNEKSDAMLRTTVLLCALVALSFSGLCVVLVLIFNNNRRKLERIAYVDAVTGGNTVQRFHELAKETLDAHPAKAYAFTYTNIESFKVLNEQFGRQACDALLKCFYQYINENLREGECIGRLFGDNFCILYEFTNEKETSDRFDELQANAGQYMQDNNITWSIPSVEFGVYIIDNRELSFAQMADRAKLALKEAVWLFGNKVAFYNDGVRRKLFREKQLEDQMESALANYEFHMFLQPKYRLPDEIVGGAEALVRWINPVEGMIFPDEFIPLFEKNGFIVKLDLWMFEEACRALRSWIDRGLKPVKISVNCSRIHFHNPSFLQPYIETAEKYRIPEGLLELELTESVVFEDTQLLIEVIRSIRAAGFGCSMDDFGSGYSSLNLIQTIPVDTLKLDKIFFRPNTVDSRRTEAVVTNIVSMAKSLSMKTVAEGVEERDQVEMLKRANCDYIQGYVFAKPMNLDSFEQLAFGTSKPKEQQN